MLEKIDNGEIAPWEGEVLQGEEVGVTPGGKTKGYGHGVLDFYGNQIEVDDNDNQINLGIV